MAVSPGSRLGPYEIVCHIGGGGMGEVYRARDTRLGRDVAIKVVAQHLVADKHLSQRFTNEARAIAALSHPNICALFDVGEQGDVQYLVMELLRGETLATRLALGPLPLLQALQIAAQIADALDQAHKHGTIHRDLKPGNVMLTESGAKLLDFGLAKCLERPEMFGQSTASTTPGAVLGTMGYMSPEQLRGITVDARGDLWSLGIILYEMISGRHPFPGPTASDTISQILAQPPPPLSRGKLEVPEALEEIILKALAKDCDERYQTARDLLLDLKRVKSRLEGHSESGSAHRASATALAHAPATLPVSQRLKRKWLPITSAVLVVAALAAFGGRMYFARRAEPSAIAVMPLTYDSSDPKAANDPERDYLADGLTENLIDAISAVSDAEVISRTSAFRYKGRDADPGQVGRELKVSRILYGKILRQGSDLKINLELVDAPTSRHLWGNQYDATMTTLMALPKEVALELAKSLHFQLRNRLLGFYTASPTAYQEYLRGRHSWNKRTEDGVKASIEYFQKAIAADPQYAMAYAGLADAYHVLWIYSGTSPRDSYLQARPAALKALELDPQLAEAHTSMAVIKADDEWDFAGAEREFRKAIELDANYATAHQWDAQCLSYHGQFDQAVAELRTAIRLDPLSPIIHATLGDILYRARRYDESAEELKKTLDIDSGFPLAHSLLRYLYETRGDFAAAIAESKAANIAWGATPEQAEAAVEELRHAYSQAGEKGYWQAQLRLIEQRTRTGQVRRPDDSPVRIAGIYARLGDDQQAFRWLAKAYDERDASILYIRTAPEFDHLRSDPRAVELIKRIGL